MLSTCTWRGLSYDLISQHISFSQSVTYKIQLRVASRTVNPVAREACSTREPVIARFDFSQRAQFDLIDCTTIYTAYSV